MLTHSVARCDLSACKITAKSSFVSCSGNTRLRRFTRRESLIDRRLIPGAIARINYSLGNGLADGYADSISTHRAIDAHATASVFPVDIHRFSPPVHFLVVSARRCVAVAVALLAVKALVGGAGPPRDLVVHGAASFAPLAACVAFALALLVLRETRNARLSDSRRGEVVARARARSRMHERICANTRDQSRADGLTERGKAASSRHENFAHVLFHSRTSRKIRQRHEVDPRLTFEASIPLVLCISISQ